MTDLPDPIRAADHAAHEAAHALLCHLSGGEVLGLGMEPHDPYRAAWADVRHRFASDLIATQIAGRLSDDLRMLERAGIPWWPGILEGLAQRIADDPATGEEPEIREARAIAEGSRPGHGREFLWEETMRVLGLLIDLRPAVDMLAANLLTMGHLDREEVAAILAEGLRP